MSRQLPVQDHCPTLEQMLRWVSWREEGGKLRAVRERGDRGEKGGGQRALRGSKVGNLLRSRTLSREKKVGRQDFDGTVHLRVPGPPGVDS